MIFIRKKSIGFLPNSDLVIVSLIDYKIYLYPLTNKLTDNKPWNYSQTYDIEISKNLNFNNKYIDFLVYSEHPRKERIKLFILTTTKFHEYDSVTMINQWNLSNLPKITFEKQYHLSDGYKTYDLKESL